MRFPRITTILVAGTLAAGLSLPLSADNSSGGWSHFWGQRHMMHGTGAGGPMMGQNADWTLNRIDGRLAFLKAELKITDKQAALWDQLATTIRSNAEVHNGMMRSMMEDMRGGKFFKKPLPDRLIFQQTHLETRLEQIKSLKEAVDKLYAALDDKQRKAADEVVLPVMGMGMGMGRGMGRHMMMH